MLVKILSQANGDWSPIPYLPIATILAIAVIAAGAGVWKNKSDSAQTAIGKLDDRMTKRDEEYRQDMIRRDQEQDRRDEEQNRRHSENRIGMEKIRESVVDLGKIVSGLQGPEHRGGYRR